MTAARSGTRRARSSRPIFTFFDSSATSSFKPQQNSTAASSYAPASNNDPPPWRLTASACSKPQLCHARGARCPQRPYKLRTSQKSDQNNTPHAARPPTCQHPPAGTGCSMPVASVLLQSSVHPQQAPGGATTAVHRQPAAHCDPPADHRPLTAGRAGVSHLRLIAADASLRFTSLHRPESRQAEPTQPSARR